MRTAPPLPLRPLAVCFALAALTLVVLRQPGYDPTAWLIWGRELTQGTLSMLGGPSWKPLPVAFTTVFAWAGDAVAPSLWLLVARVGGFAAIVLCFRVTRRLAGRTSALIAAAALALATDFLFNVLRGDSEGLLVALCLGAIDLHLSGRRRWALFVGLLAGLLRPEVWLLLALYSLWLLRADRRALPLVAGGAVALLAAWFLPDYLATGDLLRGANRARRPVPGSPGSSAFPFGLTFVFASIAVCWPIYAGAVHAVRRRDPVLRGIAAAAGVLMVSVALLAQIGFTGNIRYVTLPAALVCVLGGVGLPGLVAGLSERARRLATVPAALGVLASVGIVVWGGVRLARDERAFGPELDAAVAAAGGEAALRRCGQIATTPFERQALAYRLDLPSRDVWTHAVAPGIALVRADEALPGAAAVPVRARLPGWTLRSTC